MKLSESFERVLKEQLYVSANVYEWKPVSFEEFMKECVVFDGNEVQVLRQQLLIRSAKPHRKNLKTQFLNGLTQELYETDPVKVHEKIAEIFTQCHKVIPFLGQDFYILWRIKNLFEKQNTYVESVQSVFRNRSFLFHHYAAYPETPISKDPSWSACYMEGELEEEFVG